MSGATGAGSAGTPSGTETGGGGRGSAARATDSHTTQLRKIEWACERAEQRLREEFPIVRRVYLDPTPGFAQRRTEGLNPWP